ncbi:hypothetical protein EJB05_34466, partial [Eragrostis curvula]
MGNPWSAAEAAKAPRPWEVQAIEMREKEKQLSLIRKQWKDLVLAADEDSLSGMSEAEREAKQERAGLTREFLRVASEIKTPDYSGMTEADRIRHEALEEARRLKLEGDAINGWEQERLARIMDFDPKQRGMYFNRLYFADLATFDHDEESPFGPVRFTYKTYGNETAEACEAVNVLSVEIACSDVGFPIQVYGSVIATDSIDYKCVYLFRRDRDHCQLISSKDEPLLLTGPKRGLALLDDNYVETDLKIKDHEGKDRELSKGILTIRGIAGRSLKKCEVERGSIATRLSTVDVLYAVMKRAVEGTIAAKVVKGEFYGTITAHTTSILNRIVLYDSEVAAAKTGDDHGVIQLMRSVVSVYVKDMLIIDAKTSAGESVRLEFTPKGNSGETVPITLGATKMRVKVAWSIMDP